MEKNKIRLLKTNPRFTPLKYLDLDNLNFKEYDEKNIFLNLLTFEEELADFLILLDSISKQGFLKTSSKKMLLKKGKDNYFYIVEGNRRALALKLLLNEDNAIEAWQGLKKNFQKEIDEKKNLLTKDWNENQIEMLQRQLNSLKTRNLSNWEKANILVQKGITFDIYNDDYYEDLSNLNDLEIKQEINSKHAGEERGKRRWSRTKYFFDLKDFWEENQSLLLTNEKKFFEKASMFFDKTITVLNRDFQNAIWVTESINFYNENIEKNEKDIYSKINIYKTYASPIESLLSQKFLNIITNENKALRELIGYKIVDFKNYWKYQLSDELSNEQKKQLLILLIQKCVDGTITTRKIEDEDVQSELSDILNLSLGNSKSLNRIIKKERESNFLKVKNRVVKKQLEFLTNVSDVKLKNRIISRENDSIFIDSILYEINIMFPILSNMGNYFVSLNVDYIEYPFNHLALFIRNIYEMVLMELLYSSKLYNDSIEYIAFLQEITSAQEDKIKKEEKRGEDLTRNIKIYKNVLIANELDISRTVSNVLNNFQKSGKSTELRKIIQNKEIANSRLNVGLTKPFEDFLFHFIFDKNANFKIINQTIHKPYFMLKRPGQNDHELIKNLYNLKKSFEVIISFLEAVGLIDKK